MRRTYRYSHIVDEQHRHNFRAYRDLLRIARRFAGSEDEAQDLAQEALLIALENSIPDWSSPSRRAWLAGVVKHRALFHARSAARRRKRENAVEHASVQPRSWVWDQEFLGALPRSLQVVARLASADLTTAEIRWLLRLSPTALRTRLSMLRRAALVQNELPIVAVAPTGPHLGQRRSKLVSSLKGALSRTLATLDPDGHALFFREVAHKRTPHGNPTAHLQSGMRSERK